MSEYQQESKLLQVRGREGGWKGRREGERGRGELEGGRGGGREGGRVGTNVGKKTEDEYIMEIGSCILGAFLNKE